MNEHDHSDIAFAVILVCIALVVLLFMGAIIHGCRVKVVPVIANTSEAFKL